MNYASSYDDDDDFFYNVTVHDIVPKEKHQFSHTEDLQLKQLVVKYGTENWEVIAAHLSKYILTDPVTDRDCRERWVYYLDPVIPPKKDPWTGEEDEAIKRLHSEFGNKWCIIAKYLPGRTGIAVRHRWLYLQRQTTAPISQITPLNLRQAVGAVAPSLLNSNRGLVAPIQQAQLAQQPLPPISSLAFPFDMGDMFSFI